MNDTAPIQFQHGLPPWPSLIAVLVCAALMVTLYQKLFPRAAHWALVAAALVLGGALTFVLTLVLTPTGQRLAEIHDVWSALRIVVPTVGLPEEAVKGLAALIALLAFRLLIRAPTPAEAFQAALCAALGFAVVENALYATAFSEVSLLIALGRGFLASFIHSLMMMIQGTFLARLVASGWRRWDLVILGWLLAAAAHAGFDWGMLRPLVVYLQKGDPATMTAAVMQSLPVLLIGLPAPFILGLWLFRRALRKAGIAEEEQRIAVFGDGSAAVVDYRAKLARWRKAGKIVMILGGVALLGAIVLLVVLSLSMAPQLAAEATPTLNPQANTGGLIATGGAVAGCMALLVGWLLRQKR
jgi:RsiW-degrading membrane proteinase PrsW (M82 family)